jgi:hypothetical protein
MGLEYQARTVQSLFQKLLLHPDDRGTVIGRLREASFLELFIDSEKLLQPGNALARSRFLAAPEIVEFNSAMSGLI